jgi:hypothetical protein
MRHYVILYTMLQTGNETATMRHSLYKFTTMRHYDVRHFVHTPIWHAPINHPTHCHASLIFARQAGAYPIGLHSKYVLIDLPSNVRQEHK